MLWTKLTGQGQKIICALSSDSGDDLMFIKNLVEVGRIKTIIDKCYPLERAADAHRYYESGVRQGQVVITMPKV